MSIEVRIPKEITEYKEKILFGLTIRQLLCFILAIFLGIGTYFLSKKYVGQEIASYIVIFEVIPIFATGFFRKNGFAFEKYIKLILRHKLGKNRRKYQTEINLDGYNEKGDIRNVRNITKKKRHKESEQAYYEITKGDRKRKSKAVKRKIAQARKEFNRAKKELKKATSETKVTTECSTINKI